MSDVSLRELSDKATPGIWFVQEADGGWGSAPCLKSDQQEPWDDIHSTECYYPSAMALPDMEFIAALVSAYRSGKLVEAASPQT
jgi:hypothetical protein